MSWVAVATVGGGAAASMLAEDERQKQLSKYNQGQAEMTKYSPWTGVRGQTQQDTGPGMLGAGISGGMQGLAMGQSIKGMGGAGATQTPTAWTANDTMPQSSPYDQYRLNRFGRTS